MTNTEVNKEPTTAAETEEMMDAAAAEAPESEAKTEEKGKKDKKSDAKKLRLCLLILFCAMYIVGTCIVYQGWGDILTCVCALFYVLAILQKDSKGFRRYILVNASVWIVYDIYTLAFSGMLTHGLALVSILVAMVRLDFRKKPKVVETGEAAENR